MPNNKDPFDEIFEDKKKDDAKIIENMTLEEAKKITNKISEYGIGNYIPKGMENKIKRTFVYWVGDVGHKAIKTVLQALEDKDIAYFKGYYDCENKWQKKIEDNIKELNKLIIEAQTELGSASEEYTIYVYQKAILQELLEDK